MATHRWTLAMHSIFQYLLFIPAMMEASLLVMFLSHPHFIPPLTISVVFLLDVLLGVRV